MRPNLASGTGTETGTEENEPAMEPRRPATLVVFPLVLLPSGPDTVRRTTMHRARAPCRARTGFQLAERAGFEPAVELPPHTLSKRAPSATRTPLQRRRTFSKKLAERKGFEPLDLVKGQRFSRPSRSTTPAPLRDRAPHSTTTAFVWQRSAGAALDTFLLRGPHGLPMVDRAGDRRPDR